MPRKNGVIDKYPNYISSSLTLSAANTFTTTSLSMPIPHVTAGAASATIMEFLYVEITPTVTDLIAVGDSIDFALSLGAAPAAIPAISATTTVLRKRLLIQGATSGFPLLDFPMRYSLQDENGYGFLNAADQINVSGNSNGQAAAVSFAFRLYYRFVTLPISEYVGIVTSLMT